MPRRLDIDDDVFLKAESKCPKYLSTTGFINLILDQGLDRGVTLTERATASRKEGGASGVSSSIDINTSSIIKSKSIPESLDYHANLIAAFWKVKKGSKGDVAWKRLIGQLERLQAAYGKDVVTDQLELAINGKWSGIEVSRYESFLKPSQVKAPPKPKLTPEQEEALAEAEHQKRLKEWGLI